MLSFVAIKYELFRYAMFLIKSFWRELRLRIEIKVEY